MAMATELLIEHGLDKTFWGRRITLADKGKGFSKNDVERSGSWTTCACGKQDPNLPRWENGEPQDALLAQIGVHFDLHVMGHNPLGAATTLVQIEQRVREILEFEYD